MSRIKWGTDVVRTMFIIAFVFASIALGRVQLLTKDSTIDLEISSAGWLQSGQIVDGYGLTTQELYHQWQQQSFLDIAFDATMAVAASCTIPRSWAASWFIVLISSMSFIAHHPSLL